MATVRSVDRTEQVKPALVPGEARRKRQDDNVILSKKQRLAAVSKKRKLDAGFKAGSSDMKHDDSSSKQLSFFTDMKDDDKLAAAADKKESATHFTYRPDIKAILEQVPSILSALKSNNPDECLKAMKGLVRLTNIDVHPPTQHLVEAGVVPLVLQYMLQTKRADLQFQASWIIVNISGTMGKEFHYVGALLDNQALDVTFEFIANAVKRMASSPQQKRKEQEGEEEADDDKKEAEGDAETLLRHGLWILSNIASENDPKVTRELADRGLLKFLMDIAMGIDVLGVRTIQFLTSVFTCVIPKKQKKKKKNKDKENEMEKPVSIQSLLPIICLLVQKILPMRDADVLDNALTTLNKIAERDNESVVAVLSSGGMKRVIELVLHKSWKVKYAALRLVGSIVMCELHECSQALLDMSLLPCLIQMTANPSLPVRKETWFCISNLMAGTHQQIQALLDTDIIPRAAKIVGNRDVEFEVQREAAYALIHGITTGDPETQVPRMLSIYNVLPPLCSMLHILAQRPLVIDTLQAINTALKTCKKLGQDTKYKDLGLFAKAKQTIEECEGLDQLRILQYDAHAVVSRAAKDIVDWYFEEEGEDWAGETKMVFDSGNNTNNNHAFQFLPQANLDLAQGLPRLELRSVSDHKQQQQQQQNGWSDQKDMSSSMEDDHAGQKKDNLFAPSDGLGLPWASTRPQQQQQEEQHKMNDGAFNLELEADSAM